MVQVGGRGQRKWRDRERGEVLGGAAAVAPGEGLDAALGRTITTTSSSANQSQTHPLPLKMSSFSRTPSFLLLASPFS